MNRSSNAERIAQSERQYNGYDSYNMNVWYEEPHYEAARIFVHGKIKVFKTDRKEVR